MQLPVGPFVAVVTCLLLHPHAAGAQGWFSDRFDNAAVNVDAINARFREAIRTEVARLHRRDAAAINPSVAEQQRVGAFQPWWFAAIAQPLERDRNERSLRLGSAFLYDSALVNSQQMRVFGDLPAVRETTEAEVAGRFIPRGFAEGRYEDRNDPTRSIATTGGATRLLQRERAVEFGLRQRTLTGAEVTVGQRFLALATNSTDYLPREQAISRTFVTIVQPLLREGGLTYARSLHEVARVDTRAALAEFRRQTEAHLTEVTRAYWTLWLARAQYLQRRRLVDATRPLAGGLGAREELDVDSGSILRARAALATREADLLRARMAVRNAEARLRGLVNDPRFEAEQIGEFLPVDRPLAQFTPQTLEAVLTNAVAFRPEVQQLFEQHRAAVLREGIAQIERLPRLDLVLEGNLGGRGRETRFDDSLTETRRESNRPGGIAGLRLEVPLGRDDAAARLDRRRLETRQVESQGRATLATIVVEAEVTLNEYRVAYRELAARLQALAAARTDVNAQAERLQAGTLGAAGGADALERLLSAQERLTLAEEQVATAQATFTVAFVQLQRVAGTFTALERLDVRRIDDAARGPAYVVRRGEAGVPRPPVTGAPRP